MKQLPVDPLSLLSLSTLDATVDIPTDDGVDLHADVKLSADGLFLHAPRGGVSALRMLLARLMLAAPEPAPVIGAVLPVDTQTADILADLRAQLDRASDRTEAVLRENEQRAQSVLAILRGALDVGGAEARLAYLDAAPLAADLRAVVMALLDTTDRADDAAALAKADTLAREASDLLRLERAGHAAALDENASLRADVTAAEGEAARLRAEVERLTIEVQTASGDVEERARMSAALRERDSKLATRGAELERAEIALKGMRDDATASEAETRALRASLADATLVAEARAEELATASGAVAALRAEVSQLRADLEERATQMTELRTTADQAERLRAEVRRLDADNEGLRAQLATPPEQTAQDAADLKALTARVDELNAERSLRLDEIASIEAMLADERAASSTLRESNDALTAAITTQARKATEEEIVLRGTVDDLTARLTSIYKRLGLPAEVDDVLLGEALTALQTHRMEAPSPVLVPVAEPAPVAPPVAPVEAKPEAPEAPAAPAAPPVEAPPARARRPVHAPPAAVAAAPVAAPVPPAETVPAPVDVSPLAGEAPPVVEAAPKPDPADPLVVACSTARFVKDVFTTLQGANPEWRLADYQAWAKRNRAVVPALARVPEAVLPERIRDTAVVYRVTE